MFDLASQTDRRIALALYLVMVVVAVAGMPGLIPAAEFIVVLLLALVYLSGDGTLDIGPKARGALL